MRRISKIVFVSYIIAAIMLISLSAIASPEWMIRPGTIGHAISQPDGTHVYLDAVRIIKNQPDTDPAYYVINECC